jgi:hypothetical protein
MTIDEFENKVAAVGDWYIAEVKRIAEEFKHRMEACANDANGLPEHLVLASLAHVVKRVEAAAKDLQDKA